MIGHQVLVFPMSSEILVICVRMVKSYVQSFPRDEDCLRASNLSRIKHDSSTAMTDKFTIYGLSEYSLVAPKMQVVVVAYVVHARRHSDGMPIDESGERLRMSL